MRRTEIFAHRGASQYAPENTLEAFALAHEQKAEGIELDVQLTKDGEVVVIHDETIDRVSNGEGAVRDYTLKELRRFSFHNHMSQYGKVEIPTLREALRLIKPWRMKVNIELKTGIFWYPGIEEKTLHIVREEKMEEWVIYSSFNHCSIQKIHRLAPEAETAFLCGDIILEADRYTLAHGVNGIHPALHHVDMSGFLKQYLDSGLSVRVWTVDEKEDIERLIRAGVDAVITNRPDAALAVRQKIS